MKHNCPGCRTLVATEDRRRKINWLRPFRGAALDLRAGQAPRIKCQCGKVMIFMRGSR